MAERAILRRTFVTLAGWGAASERLGDPVRSPVDEGAEGLHTVDPAHGRAIERVGGAGQPHLQGTSGGGEPFGVEPHEPRLSELGRAEEIGRGVRRHAGGDFGLGGGRERERDEEEHGLASQGEGYQIYASRKNFTQAAQSRGRRKAPK